MSEVTTNTNPEGQESTPGTGGETTFTQAQVDALISKEKARAVAKATKGMPNSEQLEAFRNWQQSQQTEQEKWDALVKERDESKTTLASIQNEYEQLKKVMYVINRGFSAEQAEFIAFKASKMVNDDMTFQDAVEKIAPKEAAPAGGNTVKVDFGGQVSPNASNKMSINEQINHLLRGK